MNGSKSTQESSIPLEQRVDELRARLQSVDPQSLAARVGAEYHLTAEDRGEFRLELWSRPVVVAFPSFAASDAETNRPLDVMSQAVLVYYFHDSDGTPQSYRWIAFSELPDGHFYAQAFQGYTGLELLRAFGDDVSAFEMALRNIGGERLSFADVSYAFQVLPRLALLAACWLGDEDFPSSYRILFDASASHHLSTDGCAILGSMLTRKVIRSA
jgi:hypothetical protein